jgi:hypothetical protein
MPWKHAQEIQERKPAQNQNTEYHRRQIPEGLSVLPNLELQILAIRAAKGIFKNVFSAMGTAHRRQVIRHDIPGIWNLEVPGLAMTIAPCVPRFVKGAQFVVVVYRHDCGSAFNGIFTECNVADQWEFQLTV